MQGVCRIIFGYSAGQLRSQGHVHSLHGVLTRLRRRRAEYFKDSLPGLFKVAEAAANTNGTWIILDKLIQIALVVLDIAANEVVTQQKQGLYEALSIFVLVLLTKLSEIEHLDNSNVTELSLLQLARVIPTCGLSYLDIITGSNVKQITILLDQDVGGGDDLVRDAMQGGAIAVWWRFCFHKGPLDDQEAATSVSDRLTSSKHAFVTALSNVCVLFSSMEKSQKRVEMAIDLLTLILEWGTSRCEGSPIHVHPELLDRDELFNINKVMKVVENVVIFFPRSRTRQKAYHVLVNIIRNVLPEVERFMALKNLIIQSEHSSMISLLLYVMKEETNRAISSSHEANFQPNSPFASEAVLEIIAFVLRPPNGGPPELPTQMDAVLSALNLYRFILIKEVTGNSSYTGILSRARLEEASSKWLQPLRTFLEAFKRKFSAADPEATAGVLLSISNIEGVLYRCLELVEPLLKESPGR